MFTIILPSDVTRCAGDKRMTRLNYIVDSVVYFTRNLKIFPWD